VERAGHAHVQLQGGALTARWRSRRLAARPAATPAAACGGAAGPRATINLEDRRSPFGSGRAERTALAAAPELTVCVQRGTAEPSIISVRTPPLRGADVISLQEVDAAGAARIARALDMEFVYYPASIHPVEDTEFGAALLSGWPIERDWKLILPHRSFRGPAAGRSAAVQLGERGSGVCSARAGAHHPRQRDGVSTCCATRGTQRSPW
jgi:hypothetical protein